MRKVYIVAKNATLHIAVSKPGYKQRKYHWSKNNAVTLHITNDTVDVKESLNISHNHHQGET